MRLDVAVLCGLSNLLDDRGAISFDDRSDSDRKLMWLAFRPPIWLARRAFLERHRCIFPALSNCRASTFASPCVKARVRR
jgi:hypothetical protein